MTVNETLSLMKMVRERVNGLKSLRGDVSTKDIWSYSSDKEKITEPQYEVKAVDAKIVELEKFLFIADSRVKASNAVTQIELAANVDELLAPLA